MIAVLPPTLEIHLGEQGRRNLHETHAAPEARRAEAREIADHAAAQRDDDVAPLDARADQRVADPRELGVGFGRFPRRADDDAGLEPGVPEAAPHRLEVQRRDVRVGHDSAMRAGRERGDMRARGREQPLPDPNLVRAIAQRDRNFPQRLGCGRDPPRSGRPSAQRLEDHVDDEIVRAVAGFDGDVGERVGRAALLEQTSQRRLGIGGLQQRPVRSLAHAAHQDVEVRLQPDRDALGSDPFARRRVHERAAAGRKHLGSLVEQAGDHLALAVAEIGLAEALENFGDRHPRAGLDLRVGVDERQAEPLRQTAADGGLAGAHHADQHDRTPGERPGQDLDVSSADLVHPTPSASGGPPRGVS